MSAVRSIRYEPAPDITWVGGEEDDEEEEEVEDIEETEEEEGDGDDMDLDDSDEDETGPNNQGVNGNVQHGYYGYTSGYKRKAPPGRRAGDQDERPRVGRLQALPIAELPDDYDGQVLDGATYLAISARVNATLPNYTRVSVPPLERPSSSSTRVIQPQASTSRHPALPNEAWATVFPLHFTNYRSRVKAMWPPDLPYPSHLPRRPRPNNRGEVWQYIRGCRRKFLDPNQSRDKGKGKAVEANEGMAEDDEEAALNGPGPMAMEMEVEMEDDEEAAMNAPGVRDTEEDEEAAMNAPGPTGRRGNQGKGEGEYEKDEEQATETASRPKVLEEEVEKHRPHEPLVSALQGYTSVELVHIIELVTTFIGETLDLLSPFVMIPNDPEDDADGGAGADADAPPPNNPFPEIYMRWLFACLLLLDDQLDGRSMSSLRELARTAMKVAAWRWIRAVTDKEVSAEPGAEWKYGQTPSSEAQGEAGLEATLGRCWIVVHAVVAGWAQRDLLDDLECMFK